MAKGMGGWDPNYKNDLPSVDPSQDLLNGRWTGALHNRVAHYCKDFSDVSDGNTDRRK